MRKDHDSIPGQMHIGLNGVNSGLDSSPKCGHSILGMLGSVTPVGNCLWELLTILTIPGEGPTSYVNPSAASESQRSERTHEEVRVALDQALVSRQRCCRQFHREERAVLSLPSGPLRHPCGRIEGDKERDGTMILDLFRDRLFTKQERIAVLERLGLLYL